MSPTHSPFAMEPRPHSPSTATPPVPTHSRVPRALLPSHTSRIPTEPHLTVPLDPSPQRDESVISLLTSLYPLQPPSNWQITECTSGKTNVTLKCDPFPSSPHSPDSPHSSPHSPNSSQYHLPPKLIIRIFGRNSEKLIDRQVEAHSIDLLRLHSLTPLTLLRFSNGFVSEFVPGRELLPSEMRSEYRKVSAMMRRWHIILAPVNLTLTKSNSTPPDTHIQSVRPSTDKAGCEGGMGSLSGSAWSDDGVMRPILFDKMWGWYKAAVMSHKSIVEELNIKLQINRISQLVEERECGVGFCHNDLLCSNILVRDNDVFFIDYEYAGINYVAFDIGNHLCEYAGYGSDFSKIPDLPFIEEFVESYLSVRVTGDTSEMREVSEESVTQLVDDVRLFMAASHCFWGLWALVKDGESGEGRGESADERSESGENELDYGEYGVMKLRKCVETLNQFLERRE
eukprot:GHVN01039555.1.p1 GENE.GHVN01039555.1~~GHVN01039555.1.p1  ORF type:complete len:455 (-),score=141.63 GHVN01039555.1:269-1633(-)